MIDPIQKEKALSVCTTEDFQRCFSKRVNYQRICSSKATPRLLQRNDCPLEGCEFLRDFVSHLLGQLDRIDGGAA